MHRLDALLSALECRRADAFIALGVAAMDEGNRQAMLSGRGMEADLPQASVDLLHCRIELLIDRLVVLLPADVGAVELLPVEERDDRVLELHARHFARERHIADRELVLAVGREGVFDAHAAARAERHPFKIVLLT